MYILFEKFHFSAIPPGYDAIYREICEIEGTDIPVIVNRFPRDTMGPSSGHNAASRSCVHESLSLYGPDNTHLDIHVNSEDQNISVRGGAEGLFRSACLTLEKLGGTIVRPTPVRDRRTNQPRAWPWILVTSSLGFLAMLCIGLPLVIVWLGCIPILLGLQLRERWRETWLRRRLVWVGRSISATQLDAKLSSGEGTLIIEHLSSKRVMREWWTEDDLIGHSPVPLPTSPILPPDGTQATTLHAYAISCVTKYTDPTTGIAKLTKTVPALSASHRKLSEKYPRAKIAVLFVFDWGAKESIIYRSTIERVAGNGFNHG
jgi:hypothetical protein